MRVTTAICASALLLIPVSSVAQQTVAPEVLVQPRGTILPTPWLTVLRRLAAEGDTTKLASAVREALADLTKAAIHDRCCDARAQYFLVVFAAPDGTGASVPVTVLVHEPAIDTAALPGLSGADHPVFEVVLADDATSSFLATYAIAREENPAEKQAADFVATVIGKLALPLATRPDADRALVGGRDRGYPVVVGFNRVVLPTPGKLTIRRTVNQPLRLRLANRIAGVAAAEQMRRRVSDGEGNADAACEELSGTIRDRLAAALRVSPCGSWIAEPASCTKKLGDEIAQAANLEAGKEPRCSLGETSAIAQDYAAATQDTKPVTATTSIGNSELVRYGFGLVAGYVARIGIDNAHPRVSMQSGKIEANPFTRALLMGVVNLTPWGFDSQRLSASAAERFRFFAGAAFAPNFGVSGGAGWELNRYLTLSGGYARLWFDAPKPGEQIDQVPTAANRGSPFELRSTGAWFVGVGYNLR